MGPLIRKTGKMFSSKDKETKNQKRMLELELNKGAREIYRKKVKYQSGWVGAWGWLGKLNRELASGEFKGERARGEN